MTDIKQLIQEKNNSLIHLQILKRKTNMMHSNTHTTTKRIDLGYAYTGWGGHKHICDTKAFLTSDGNVTCSVHVTA